MFVNGLEEDGTPSDTRLLSARLSDVSEDGAMWVGLSSNGKVIHMHLKYICLEPIQESKMGTVLVWEQQTEPFFLIFPNFDF